MGWGQFGNLGSSKWGMWGAWCVPTVTLMYRGDLEGLGALSSGLTEPWDAWLRRRAWNRVDHTAGTQGHVAPCHMVMGSQGGQSGESQGWFWLAGRTSQP